MMNMPMLNPTNGYTITPTFNPAIEQISFASVPTGAPGFPITYSAGSPDQIVDNSVNVCNLYCDPVIPGPCSGDCPLPGNPGLPGNDGPSRAPHIFAWEPIQQGINSDSAVSNIKILPNPASKNITVLIGSSKAANIRLNILNSTGVSVLTNLLKCSGGNNSFQLDISGIVPGIYFCIFKDEYGITLKLEKLVIQ